MFEKEKVVFTDRKDFEKVLAENLNADNLDEKWESQEEPDVCEEHYQRTKETIYV